MKHATATSIGSAMQLAYAYGGRAPVTFSADGYAERDGRPLRLPAYTTALVTTYETHWILQPVDAGRIADPILTIALVGDALRDL